MEVLPGGGSTEPESDPKAEAVLFVVEGSATLTIEGTPHELKPGSYVYMPPAANWAFQNSGDATVKFHWIRKKYEYVGGLSAPDAFITNERDISPTTDMH